MPSRLGDQISGGSIAAMRRGSSAAHTLAVMAGRETRGWLRVSLEGVKTKRQLQGWVNRGVDYAKSLPPK